MTPTVPQMVNRSLSGHHRALKATAEGRPVLGPTAPPSEVRGMRTVLATLRRWDCVRTPEGAPAHLTDRGEALLAALDERAAA